jgi:methionyl-tRNA formyltransferase
VKKLDTFIIKAFLGPFFLCLVVATFTLMLQFLWLYIDELIGKGLGFSVIMEFLAWGTVTVISMSLPIAVLLGSTMSMGNLGEFNELLAMKSTGVSLQRIFTPLFFVNILICICAFYATNNLIPHAFNKLYGLRYDIGNKKEEIRIPTGIFYDGIDGYNLRIGSRDEKSGIMYDVMVYDHRDRSGKVNLTLADSGLIRFTQDKQNLIFSLFDGYSYEEEDNQNRPQQDTLNQYRQIGFLKQELIISLSDYAFQRSEDSLFQNEIMAQNLSQLRIVRDSLDSAYTNIKRYQIPMVIRSGLNYSSELDTTYRDRYTASIEYDSLYKWRSVMDYDRALNRGIADLESSISLLTGYEHEERTVVKPLRRSEHESFRKFTVAIVCMLFFFIGAPLGAIMRKGGIGTPVIIAIFFFVLYWVVDISGKKLAIDGAVPPAVGALVSTALLLPIGVFLVNKAKNDSNIFNPDIYRLFFTKIASLFRTPNKAFNIVYMGTPGFAVEPLNTLIEKGYTISAVVTAPDKPVGRGLKVGESEIKQYALEKGLKILQPHSLRDETFIQELSALNPKLIVVVAFRMLPESVRTIPLFGTINLHASLLPQYRGAAPINWAIINGEKLSGVTTFFIDNKIDTGEIIAQKFCEIAPSENAGDLHDKLMHIGAGLLADTVESIKNRRYKITSQETSFQQLSPAPKLTKENTAIDWNRDAQSLFNLIRGLSPYPTAHTNFTNNGSSLQAKIFEAGIPQSGTAESNISETDLKKMEPGSIISDGKSYLRVVCGNSEIIEITSLQLAGKKRLSVKEFLAGIHDIGQCRFSNTIFV